MGLATVFLALVAAGWFSLDLEEVLEVVAYTSEEWLADNERKPRRPHTFLAAALTGALALAAVDLVVEALAGLIGTGLALGVTQGCD